MQADKKKKNCWPTTPRPNAIASQAGFTLLEVLAVMAILGIVMVMAVPAMSRWRAHYRLVGTTNEMVSALRLAQTHAIMGKREVWVCVKHRYKPGCGYDSSNFHQWLVAVPALGQTSTSSNENVLRQVDIADSLEVRDCLLNDTTFKVAPNGRFYKTIEERDIHVRICAPELAGNNGTREIRINGGVVHVTRSDASCSKFASCT